MYMQNRQLQTAVYTVFSTFVSDLYFGANTFFMALGEATRNISDQLIYCFKLVIIKLDKPAISNCTKSR